MATVHLISGLPCSGKTTYADGLRASHDCAMFSLDRWLITAFGQYAISEAGQDEHTRRVLACRELIWDVALEFLARSVDVILDDGFFLRAHRLHYVQAANGIGAKTKIHHLDTPVSVIRARLEQRNAKLPAYNFSIDPESLETFVAWFETPSASEGAEIILVRGQEAPTLV